MGQMRRIMVTHSARNLLETFLILQPSHALTDALFPEPFLDGGFESACKKGPQCVATHAG